MDSISKTVHVELDTTLSPEQVARVHEVRTFARDVMRPVSAELDSTPADQVPSSEGFWRFVRGAHALGIQGAGFGPDVQGPGLSLYELSMLYEELGWGSAGMALSLVVSRIPFATLMHFGTPELIRDYVLPYVTDREGRIIGCYPVTEPEHGSDLFYIDNPGPGVTLNPPLNGLHFETTARLDGNEWVLTGEKAPWITNTSFATHALVLASVEGHGGPRASAGFFVPLDLPGIERGKPLEKLGQRDMNQASFSFDNVRIPRHYMVVAPERYKEFFAAAFGPAFVLIGAVCVGVARAALEEAVAYSKRRVQGGRPLAEHQDVQRRLSDLFAEVEFLRAYVRRLGSYYSSESPEPLLHYATVARGQLSKRAFQVCSDALELFGHVGFTRGELIEKIYRDARLTRMMGGSGNVAPLRGAWDLLAD